MGRWWIYFRSLVASVQTHYARVQITVDCSLGTSYISAGKVAFETLDVVVNLPKI